MLVRAISATMIRTATGLLLTMACLWQPFSSTPVTTNDTPVMLFGAGSTFAREVYLSWMAAYKSLRSPFLRVQMKYNARGSGYGQSAIMNKLGSGVHINYAGSDSVLGDAAYRQQPDLQMFPSIAG